MTLEEKMTKALRLYNMGHGYDRFEAVTVAYRPCSDAGLAYRAAVEGRFTAAGWGSSFEHAVDILIAELVERIHDKIEELRKEIDRTKRVKDNAKAIEERLLNLIEAET